MTNVTRDWPGFQLEARDTEVAISFWNEKARQFGKPPPLGKFDLSTFANWSFRFAICADTVVPEDSAFLSFGPGLAKLLDLPQRPVMHAPMLTYIPDRYRFIFTEGCTETINEAAPVRFSGELAGAEGSTELYRACFMPLAMANKISMMVCGSFNYVPLSVRDIRERSGHARFADPGDHLPFSGPADEPIR